jgi:SPP1 gp7 family putative phage head morphogenesis protein
MIARARTLAQIRFLNALGPLERPRRQAKRLPIAQHPDGIIDAYADALIRAAVAPAIAEAREIRGELVRALGEHRRQLGRHDANDQAHAERAIAHAAARAAGAMRPTALQEAAAHFGRETEAWQRHQIDRQVRAAIGVSFAAIERPIRDLVPGFVKANVALIRTVPERLFARLRGDVADAFASGEHPSTFAARLEERDGMAEGDAYRIARDQIGTLNGQVNEARQRSIGVDSFTWRGMMDNRERDSHRDLEGETFPWDDPPVDEDTGEPITPGSPIQCRCFAEPVLVGLAGGDEE